MLDSRIARSPGSARSASYGWALPVTTSRARWKIAFERSWPRAWLSCSTTPATRVTYSALSVIIAIPTIAVTPAICLPLMPRRIQENSLRSRNFLLRRVSSPQPIELVVQRFQADSQDFRRTRLVVARVLEREQDQTPLGFLHRHTRLEGDGRRRSRGCRARERRQMLGLDEFASA